ncbi:SynChlorMet cassette radical SAM/SPASM protein ScmF [Methanogenium cariaci]|jgi:SynChlorMet cassette radical SAM/SPASM protein ScmF
MSDEKETPPCSLSTIYFYLTPECNLACRHCWISPTYKNTGVATEYLPLDQFISIVEEAAPLGLQTVKLTGGEPLIHPQIDDILEYLKESDYRLIVETNGTLITKENAALIASCKNAFVSVSLDGIDAQTHEWVRGVTGCFDASCRAVKILADAGLKPQVIMSVMRHNVGQIEEMIRLAESLGAGSVKYNIVQPTARGETMHTDGQTLSVPELIDLGNRVEDTIAKTTDLRLVFSLPHAFHPLSRMFGTENNGGCGTCSIRSIIGVLGDGSYALCGIGETTPDMVFGNVRTDRLEELWQNSTVLNDIRTGLPTKLEGICARCVMKHICQGSCLLSLRQSVGPLLVL